MSFDITPRTLRDPIVMLIERYLQRRGVVGGFASFGSVNYGSTDSEVVDIGDGQVIQLEYDADEDVSIVRLQTSRIEVYYEGIGISKKVTKIGMFDLASNESGYIDIYYDANDNAIEIAPGNPP